MNWTCITLFPIRETIFKLNVVYQLGYSKLSRHNWLEGGFADGKKKRGGSAGLLSVRGHILFFSLVQFLNLRAGQQEFCDSEWWERRFKHIYPLNIVFIVTQNIIKKEELFLCVCPGQILHKPEGDIFMYCSFTDFSIHLTPTPPPNPFNNTAILPNTITYY